MAVGDFWSGHSPTVVSGAPLQHLGLWTTWMGIMKKLSKGHTLYDSIYLTFLKGQNYRAGEEIRGCRELGHDWGAAPGTCPWWCSMSVCTVGVTGTYTWYSSTELRAQYAHKGIHNPGHRPVTTNVRVLTLLTIFQCCKMLPRGKLNEEPKGLLFLFLQLLCESMIISNQNIIVI